MPKHLTDRLPPKVRRLLRQLGRLADEQQVGLYLVGGLVRDLLMNRSNDDLDLTVEGDALAFARLVASHYRAGMASFDRFATARLIWPDGHKVDIAGTRRESYAKPAALPQVQPASLPEDLCRRDFTINAMAIQLNAAHWGELHDPYEGQRDLTAKILRVLHDRSFVDDPTRVFRAVRFAERFGFHLEPKTSRLLREAAATDMLSKLSGPRLANEIFLLMQERHPGRVTDSLIRFRLTRVLHPRLRHRPEATRLIAMLPRAETWWRRHRPRDPIDYGMLRLMALVSQADASMLHEIRQRLQLSTAHATSLEWAGEQTRHAASLISDSQIMRPSQVYRLLIRAPNEALVLILGKVLVKRDGTRTRRLMRRLVRFLEQDRRKSTIVKGEDLKRLGLKPGPRFKQILDRLLDERLDGTVTAASEERALARRLCM